MLLQRYDFYTDLEIFYWNKDMYEECICEQIEKVEKNIDKPYLAKNMVNFCFEEVTEKDNTQNMFNTLFPILLQKGLEGRYGALMILSHIFSEEWYTGRMFSSNKGYCFCLAFLTISYNDNTGVRIYLASNACVILYVLLSTLRTVPLFIVVILNLKLL